MEDAPDPAWGVWHLYSTFRAWRTEVGKTADAGANESLRSSLSQALLVLIAFETRDTHKGTDRGRGSSKKREWC